MKRTLIVALLAVPLITQAELIDQTGSDGGVGWNSSTLWGGTEPAIGNDYRTVAGLIAANNSKIGVTDLTSRVRALSGSPVFAGDSLELVPKTEVLIKDFTTYSANIVLNGGVVRFSPNSAGNATLEGTIDVVAESYLGVVQSAACVFTVNSILTGSNLLHLAGGDGGGNTLVLAGDLSGFSGTLDLGGGNNIITLDFAQDYDLPAVRVRMGDHASADILNLDQVLKFKTFVFDGVSLQPGTIYDATDLNLMFGSGTQFVDGGGTLAVYESYLAPTPTLLSRSPAPNATIQPEDFPIVLGGTIEDSALSSVDPNSVSLVLGTNTLALSAGDVVKNATTTTVSHVVSLLDAGAHTLSLIYSATGAETGPFTNTWSFTVAAEPGEPGNRVYVDADTANTLSWNGSMFDTWVPAIGTSDGAHTNWGYRSFGNNGVIYQSGFTSSAPRLQTTVSGLADSTYRVYAYMWVEGSSWRIGASLTNSVDPDLPVYTKDDYPTNTNLYVHYQDDVGANPWGSFATLGSPYYSTNLPANPFGTNEVMLAEGNRRLVEIYLGTVTGTGIAVFIDDDSAASGANQRTWYDGIGYEQIGGASFDPEIQSIGISGGMVTLVWTSETLGTYSIMHKTNLTDAQWTPLKTGIAGGDPTTTDSVSVSGAAQEFFRIEGQ